MIHSWGPMLWQTRVDQSIADEFVMRGLLIDTSIGDRLASTIKDVREYTDREDLEWIVNSLSPYWEQYLKHQTPKPQQVNLAKTWINFQKANELNPEHLHDSDFSWVLYASIPEELKQEYQADPDQGAGTITFRYGEQMPYSRNQNWFFPEAGDMFVFPSWLAHWVTPFTSNCTRVSVSGNLLVS